jgi:hypothetical protein
MSTAFPCFKFCIHESSNSVSKASEIMTGAEAVKSEHISCKSQLGHKSQQRQAFCTWVVEVIIMNMDQFLFRKSIVKGILFQKDSLIIDLCKTRVMNLASTGVIFLASSNRDSNAKLE